VAAPRYGRGTRTPCGTPRGVAARPEVRAQEGASSPSAQSDRDYEDARQRNDVAAVNALLAPEYYAITSGGERREPGNSGLEPFNASLDSDDRERSVISDHRIRVYGDTAVSTYNRHSVGRGLDGRTRSKDLVRTNVWVRHLRHWRLALSHATTVER
jgi:ketosteroid isomerase-like protein